ncbi:MAG: hypothetical protein V4747_11305 [Pseudomonadota bacterium]
MSMNITLAEIVQDGRLIPVTPLLGGHRKRVILATAEVLKELSPSTAQYVDPSNAGQLRAWVDGFTAGRRVTVGSDKNRLVDVKILNPQADEVWEIRKRDEPSTRIFGRFAMKDVFIATNIKTSRDLFSVQWITGEYIRWPVWRQEIRRCKTVWRNIFAAYEPVSGGQLNDYLSNFVDERN